MSEEMNGTQSGYDRKKEVAAFDATKSGVKGLVDDGVEKIPRIFIHPSDEKKPSPDPNNQLKIPIIDLEGVTHDSIRRSAITEQVLRASESGGFFQLVNHGVPGHVLDAMIEGVRRFHEQPNEVKSLYYTRDVTKKVRYNTNFDLYQSPAANWRDTIYCHVVPDPPKPEDLPVVCRDILMEFSRHIHGLGITLFELVSEALGLETKHLQDMGCAEGLALICHYYPPCPQPELTMGTTKHSDSDFVTILLQDRIGGLQVCLQDQWIDVTPIHGALVVNIGDLLQLVSNDILKSSEHRVLAKREGPRISVACFFRPEFTGSENIFGPIKELVSKENPPKYRETSVKDYVTYFYKKGLDGSSAIADYKLSV